MAEPSQSPRRGARAAALLVLVAGLSACNLLPGGQGDPNAPILVRGTVIDANGLPVGDATLQLEVLDFANGLIGEPVPDVFHEVYAASRDGTFSIHLVPSTELIAFVLQDNGIANFKLVVFGQDGTPIISRAFPREIKGGTWAGDVPVIELRAPAPA